MKKIFGVILAGLLVPTLLWAGQLSFTKKVNAPKLAVELETATGFKFGQEVFCSSCTQTGWIQYAGDKTTGKLVVGIYESLDPERTWITSATWSQALQDTITATVEAHTP